MDKKKRGTEWSLQGALEKTPPQSRKRGDELKERKKYFG